MNTPEKNFADSAHPRVTEEVGQFEVILLSFEQDRTHRR